MSASITIAVTMPLETLATFASGEGHQAATESVTKSVIASVEAIPYDVKRKTGSACSTTKNEPSNTVKAQSTARSATQGYSPPSVTGTIDYIRPQVFTINVKFVSGKTRALSLSNTCRWSDLARVIQALRESHRTSSNSSATTRSFGEEITPGTTIIQTARFTRYD